MAFVKGRAKTGGKQKGTPNKSSASVREKLERLSCDPIEGMATIAMNNLPCGVCRSEGRTRYRLPDGQHSECDDILCLNNRAENSPDPKFWCDWCSNTGTRMIAMRTCQSCYGTLFEACSPAERGKMYAELAQYQHTKLKAIEHTGADGGPIDHKMEVIFVNAENGRPKLTAGSSQD